MFHVLPPDGAVVPGSMPFELSSPSAAIHAADPEADGAAEAELGLLSAPPEGHLSIPTPPEDPFNATDTEMAPLGFTHILQYSMIKA